jgi:asparagine synthase (glutamine-hydrolysing)
MCGIAGLRLPHGATPERAALEAMATALSHRGPDDTGTLVAGGVGLAQTRLSLLDLSSAGHQPMVRDHWALVFNGEIYNFREERTLLEADGATFSSTSDTEVLLESLIRRGLRTTVERMRGMFAFVLCDTRDGTLWFGRDRLGIKPLVVLERDGAIWFASEAKAIQAVTSLQPDPIVAAFSLSGMADHSGWYTAFHGLAQIPPGCFAVAAPGEALEIERYYDLDAQVDADLYAELDALPIEAVTDRFSDLMDASIEAMLVSDAPMGAFVSGGIDSSLVATVAARYRPDLALFTSDVRGRHSEVDDARAVARDIGLELHEAPFQPSELLTGWARCTWHYEAPIVTHTNAIPFASVAGLARSTGVKAVLTGEGADELFLGYPRLAADRYRKRLRGPSRAVEGAYGLVPGLREYVFPKPDRNAEGFLGLLVQGFERQRQRDVGLEAYAFLPEDQRHDHYRTTEMLREHLLSLLHRNDRMGMLNSIESRFPFLDEDVIRFGVNLPLRHKIRRTRRLHDKKHPFLVDKAVVRALGERELAPAIASKRKNGFPMYGHSDLVVQPDALLGGYVAELVGLSSPAARYMADKADPYFIAKLVSVEVFGRLFALGHTVDAVDAWIADNVAFRPGVLDAVPAQG